MASPHIIFSFVMTCCKYLCRGLVNPNGLLEEGSVTATVSPCLLGEGGVTMLINLPSQLSVTWLSADMRSERAQMSP